jgi:hypothetical protein
MFAYTTFDYSSKIDFGNLTVLMLEKKNLYQVGL